MFHIGFSGSGFVNLAAKEGYTITTLNIPEDSKYVVTINYATQEASNAYVILGALLILVMVSE